MPKSFYLNLLLWQHKCIPYFTPKKVYFEFGVAENNMLITYIEAVKEFCKKYNLPISEFIIYGFDSFSGLPTPDLIDKHVDWNKGRFSCNRKVLEDNIRKTGFPMENVHLIEGYFKDTLTPDLLQDLQSKKHFPSIVTVDCDYYSSTKTVMDWLYPLLSSGCIFYFDDIWSFHGHPELGQLKYINEFNNSGKGYLTSFHYFGGAPSGDQVKMFARKNWEWTE